MSEIGIALQNWWLPIFDFNIWIWVAIGGVLFAIGFTPIINKYGSADWSNHIFSFAVLAYIALALNTLALSYLTPSFAAVVFAVIGLACAAITVFYVYENAIHSVLSRR